ncbi:MAG: glutamine synthetase [Zhaonellaceae bacterium]|jgi:glutamine synthetase|nr:glutamine synthetase [Clostridia bacterium]
MNKSLLYSIPSGKYTTTEIRALLEEHSEIKFVSLVGVDLGGNDTDEKIPIKLFLENIEEFLSGGIQTDGSSVVLPGIATLNNGKVDFLADTNANWFVDYNMEHFDKDTGLPIGTLRIPSFLLHEGQKVDSRAILQKACQHFQSEMISLLKSHPQLAKSLDIDIEQIKSVELTAATELEFWVSTPDDIADIEQLSASQVMQEQYWKRTRGLVRTALEKSLLLLDKYGLEPEMGHKEVGGVKAKINSEGKLNHIMEQLEIDWKYAEALQSADNELLARTTIKETFQSHGLDVTFMAKPIEGVAGNGKHTHLGVRLRFKDGTVKNLFTPQDPTKDYLNPIGWGALMGILKNYEVVNPFISSTNDALNRLKPGFEAPVCIVASVGHNVQTPSRNRTVLVGLIRDLNNPLATRFEVRSPNPHTNTYLAMAALYQAMLDGIIAAIKSGKSANELEKEISKKPGQESFYLETDRAYRSEQDVFEHYSEDERSRFFGNPPATVWENLLSFSKYPNKKEILLRGNVFSNKVIDSYSQAALIRWKTELCNRIIPDNIDFIRSLVKLHQHEDNSNLDELRWNKINELRHELMKDTLERKSLFTRIREALEQHNYDLASQLQLEMANLMSELKALYTTYKRNIMDIEMKE